MPINLNEYREADTDFQERVTAELQRATATLKGIATLLRAGLADPQLLREFREAVDRAREVGWIVQQSLDSQQRQEIAELLFAHRARAMLSLLKHLREDFKTITPNAAIPMHELLESTAGFLDIARDCGLLRQGQGTGPLRPS
jgi:predicted TIM-barrel fold metal-dependent hydrolase